jgi:hypothetical protein
MNFYTSYTPEPCYGLTVEELKRLINRLRDLQHGAHPDFEHAGICSNIRNVISYDVRSALLRVFSDMGLNSAYPLESHSEYTKDGGHWAGERGERRRAFCGRVADFLEERSKA